MFLPQAVDDYSVRDLKKIDHRKEAIKRHNAG
jgi:hypothetical protein